MRLRDLSPIERLITYGALLLGAGVCLVAVGRVLNRR